MIVQWIVLLIISTFSLAAAQDINDLIEKIFQANIIQERESDSLINYKFKQKINFVKLDGDDKIDEQSLREFEVFVKSKDERERVLLTAQNYEDGKWQDVTEEKADNNKHEEGEKFSLNEMVGPEHRDKYKFSYIGTGSLNKYPVIHIKADFLEEDEDYFNGDLWIHAEKYTIVRASLVPSDFPTGIEYMKMDIEMDQIEGHWVPVQIHMNAEISFMLIFSGKIMSDISFYDYDFNLEFDEEDISAGQ